MKKSQNIGKFVNPGKTMAQSSGTIQPKSSFCKIGLNKDSNIDSKNGISNEISDLFKEKNCFSNTKLVKKGTNNSIEDNVGYVRSKNDINNLNTTNNQVYDNHEDIPEEFPSKTKKTLLTQKYNTEKLNKLRDAACEKNPISSHISLHKLNQSKTINDQAIKIGPVKMNNNIPKFYLKPDICILEIDDSVKKGSSISFSHLYQKTTSFKSIQSKDPKTLPSCYRHTYNQCLDDTRSTNNSSTNYTKSPTIGPKTICNSNYNKNIRYGEAKLRPKLVKKVRFVI